MSNATELPLRVYPHKHFTGHQNTGLTLRDHFAGLALQSLMQSDTALSELNYAERAAYCYKQADAMLKAREAE